MGPEAYDKIEEIIDQIHLLENILKGYESKKYKPTIGQWVKLPSGFTPGGTPVYACGNCGGGIHLHGVECPKRKLFCNTCGNVNYYPWEEVYDV